MRGPCATLLSVAGLWLFNAGLSTPRLTFGMRTTPGLTFGMRTTPGYSTEGGTPRYSTDGGTPWLATLSRRYTLVGNTEQEVHPGYNTAGITPWV